jgi:hypothetical protein
MRGGSHRAGPAKGFVRAMSSRITGEAMTLDDTSEPTPFSRTDDIDPLTLLKDIYR